MLLLYQIFFPLVAVGILAKIAFSGRAAALKEGGGEFSERLGGGDIPEHLAGARPVWFHAASAGEVAAAAALIKRLKEMPDAPAVVLTTSTVSGRARARKGGFADAVWLAPMDFFPAVSRFLNRLRPRALILVETELWPMTLWLAKRRGLGLGIVNGRMTARAFGRYRWIAPLMRSLLSGVDRAAFQSADDLKRFTALGLPEGVAQSTGNVKYDQLSPPEDAISEARKRIEDLGLGDKWLWVAGSTRRGEEEIIIEAYRRLRGRFPDLRLVLAPRHPERTEEVLGLLRQSSLPSARWSQLLPFAARPEVILVDIIGPLGALFALSKAAFVGGTLVPVGGHNLLEPALSSVPVLFGPYVANVQEVAEHLERSGGGSRVSEAGEFSEKLEHWLADPESRTAQGAKAKQAAVLFSGATARTLDQISSLLKML